MAKAALKPPEVTSFEKARDALKAIQSRKDKIESLMTQHSIYKMQAEIEALKEAATAWAVESETERIDFQIGKKHFHATLVEQAYGSQFIGTEDDMPADASSDAKPLSEILAEKFGGSIDKKGSLARKVWLRVTKRVVDKEAVEELVAEKALTVDELAPCFYEKQKKPYLRIFTD